jgi:pimeloyl-ACP methyl ester carboxylesterase
LTVPLDATDVAGPTLPIAVVRYPARDPRHRIGSLVVNPGGPGESGVDFLQAAIDSFPPTLRDRFDLVSFDPRGVGASAPVRCSDDLDPLFDQSFSPADVAARAALVDAVRAVVAGCVARSGQLLAHVSTADTARDLDRLRVALGDRRLTYLGYSYGTYLGTVYAALFPTRVRAMTLDGAIDPQLDATASTLVQARGVESGLDDFLARCAAQRGCEFHHGGSTATAYDTLRARLARTPVVQGSRVLDQTRFDAGVTQALYGGRAEWSELAHALSRAEHGRPGPLLQLADSFLGRRADGSNDHSLDQFWAISCLDGPPVGDPADAARLETQAVVVAPRLGAFVVNVSLACAEWPVPAVAPTPLPSGPLPSLVVVGTTEDPITPLVSAQALARELPGAVLLTARGDTHTSFDTGNRCVDDAVTRYLVSTVPPRTGTRC